MENYRIHVITKENGGIFATNTVERLEMIRLNFPPNTISALWLKNIIFRIFLIISSCPWDSVIKFNGNVIPCLKIKTASVGNVSVEGGKKRNGEKSSPYVSNTVVGNAWVYRYVTYNGQGSNGLLHTHRQATCLKGLPTYMFKHFYPMYK